VPSGYLELESSLVAFWCSACVFSSALPSLFEPPPPPLELLLEPEPLFLPGLLFPLELLLFKGLDPLLLDPLPLELLLELLPPPPPKLKRHVLPSWFGL